MRGLCWRTGFDTQYIIINDNETGMSYYIESKYERSVAGMVKFVGKKHTTILYDSNLYQWNISVANNPNILGISFSTMKSLLIGLHEFDIFGDFECNSRPYKVKLSLRQAFKVALKEHLIFSDLFQKPNWKPFTVLVQKKSLLVAMELVLILIQDVTISMIVLTDLMRQNAAD